MISDRVLFALLRHGVRAGRIDLTLADGSEHSFGPGGERAAALTGNGLRVVDLATGEAADLPLRDYQAVAFSPSASSKSVSAGGTAKSR